jgi:hypothetical protein
MKTGTNVNHYCKSSKKQKISCIFSRSRIFMQRYLLIDWDLEFDGMREEKESIDVPYVMGLQLVTEQEFKLKMQDFQPVDVSKLTDVSRGLRLDECTAEPLQDKKEHPSRCVFTLTQKPENLCLLELHEAGGGQSYYDYRVLYLCPNYDTAFAIVDDCFLEEHQRDDPCEECGGCCKQGCEEDSCPCIKEMQRTLKADKSASFGGGNREGWSASLYDLTPMLK